MCSVVYGSLENLLLTLAMYFGIYYIIKIAQKLCHGDAVPQRAFKRASQFGSSHQKNNTPLGGLALGTALIWQVTPFFLHYWPACAVGTALRFGV